MGALVNKFPRTVHLHGSHAARDDRVLSREETRRLLAEPLAGDEKLDGANLGVYFTPEGELVVQNRGHALGRGEHPQFAPLWPWLAERRDALRERLGDGRYVLYGEWCYARHSLRYTRLPAYFLAFDLYEPASGTFLARHVLHEVVAGAGVHLVPRIFSGEVLRTTAAVEARVVRSRFADVRAEGVVLRLERGDALVTRAKWVRGDFTAGITAHWRDRPVEPNQLAPEGGAS